MHGTLVVPASGGGYQTEDIQRGKVTAISSSSLTVVSPDNYTKTYQVSGSISVIPGNGSLSTVKVGDQVSLIATAHGSTAAATSIVACPASATGMPAQAVATRDNPQAEGEDVWARPGLPRDRAGPRHQRIPDPPRTLSAGRRRIWGVRVAVTAGPGRTALLQELAEDGSGHAAPTLVNDFPAAVADDERAGLERGETVRWVWADTSTAYPSLLRARVSGWTAATMSRSPRRCCSRGAPNQPPAP